MADNYKVETIKKMILEQMEFLRKNTHPIDLPQKEKNFKSLMKTANIENFINDVETDIYSLLNQ